MKKIFRLLVVIMSCFLFACSKNTGKANLPPVATDCNGIDSHFAAVVLPIIQANCATVGCHASGSSNGPGTLTNFLQISSASVNIKSAVLSGQMPKGSSLNAQNKNTIICWVNSGAPNN